MSLAADIPPRPQLRVLGGGKVDYRTPAGDPGLFGPDARAWRVHANPIALAVGGVAAVYSEGGRLGRMFGAAAPPDDVARVAAWFDRMRPKLVPHAIIGEFLEIVATTSPLGLAGRALQPLVVQAAIDLLPADIRTQLGLQTKPLRLAVARRVLGGMARLARRTPLEPVRDAYARMGRTPA